jgi:signal transduction histidine kinase
VKLYSESARSKNLDIQCEIGAGIPLTVFGDEPKFRQVLSNLVSNVVKFTKQGRVDIGLSAVQGSFAAGAQTL